ncbi:MAG: HAD family hydrolase [Candidatus Neomarinimicrobiota bacterium]
MNNKKPSSMIFDLDGTLIDTIADIGNSVNDILNEFNYEIRSTSFYRNNVGGGIRDLLERALPKDHGRPIDAYIEPLNRFYRKNLNKEAKVFPYVIDILKKLKDNNIPTAVISNKPHEFTVECVNKFFPEYINITIGSGEEFPLKPDPKSANYVLKQFNIDSKQSYFVGDSGFDIETARNSNMISIGVLWGLSDEKKISSFSPDYLFKEPLDLLKFLDVSLDN